MNSLKRLPQLFTLMVMVTVISVAVSFNALWLVVVGVIGSVASQARRFRIEPSRWQSLIVQAILVGLTIGAASRIFFPGEQEERLLVQYLVLLLVVKLFDMRSNRDYTQVFALSATVVTGVSVLGPDYPMVSTVCALVYALVAVYVMVLFALYRDLERVGRRAVAVEQFTSLSQASRAYRFPARSLRLRRTYLLIVGPLLLISIAVFVLFPRQESHWKNRSIISNQPAMATVGFSDSFTLGETQRLYESDEIVMRVRYSSPVLVQNMLLRGSVYQRYVYRKGQWQWRRDLITPASLVRVSGDDIDQPQRFLPEAVVATGRLLVDQEITLEPIGTEMLFAMYHPVAISAEKPLELMLGDTTGTLRCLTRQNERLTYRVISDLYYASPGPGLMKYRGSVSGGLWDRLDYALTLPNRVVSRAVLPHMAVQPFQDETEYELSSPPAEEDSVIFARVGISDEIRQLALQAVGGISPELTDQQAVSEAAAKIRIFLARNYSYSMDMTDRDTSLEPITEFLFHRKSGHCELFATAMVQMTRSLGMQSRLVTGFSVHEYNPSGDYYLVRQRDAHAWVEVYLPGMGWRAFDPTGSGGPAQRPYEVIAMNWFEQWQDAFRHNWQRYFFGYSNAQRQNVLRSIEQRILSNDEQENTSSNPLKKIIMQLLQLLETDTQTNTTYQVLRWCLFALIVVAVLVSIHLLAGYLRIVVANQLQRLRNRKQADQVTYENADTVYFYEKLKSILRHHGVQMQSHRTAGELAASLAATSDHWQDMPELIGYYHQVRYGKRDLDGVTMRRVDEIIESLQQTPDEPTGRDR